MKIKSYFARTVEDAVATASQELGTEAMLIQSRRTLPEARHLGEYEVVFASELPAAEAPQPQAAPVPQADGGRLAKEVADLKKELESMRRSLARSVLAPAQWAGAPPGLSEAYATLTAGDVSPDLAREIVQATEARITGPRGQRRSASADATAFEAALIEEMESRFAVQPALGRGEARPSVVALVGPPGAGKTATLVKLAVNYGLAGKRPALLLSADTYRVAAAEQLRSFAAILGVGFEVLETEGALAQAIEENRGKDLILIDTPGFGFPDLDSAAALARFLSTRDDIDTQLVLSSSMKSADLSRVVDAFEVFRPQRLVFTKLDETSSFGPIFNEAVRTGKPLSFFTTGQRIPEDLEAASRSRLVGLILAGQCGQARTAA